MNPIFYKCGCFLTDNYFLKKYNIHVKYYGKENFKNDYSEILSQKGCQSSDDWDALFEELEAEYKRRKTLDELSAVRKQEILANYIPLHPEIYSFQESYLCSEFLDLIKLCKKKINDLEDFSPYLKDVSSGYKLYVMPVFTKDFCQLLIEELVNFELSPLPKGRPNTMNNFGILLNELGMDEGFLKPFRQEYLEPLSKVLFPEWTGPSLDSHKAFVVIYKMGEDVDLSGHYDNAEVTLNVCLGQDFEGGELYFGDIESTKLNENYFIQENKPTFGILHRGQQYHGAFPIMDGERYNMIIWMRSSHIRNKLCPMCHSPPTLTVGLDAADGFTETEVELCSLT